MTLKNFLSINGIMFVPFGLMMLFMPAMLFPMLKINLDADGLLMASTVGSMLLSFGLVCWFARNEKDNSSSLKAILIGNLVFHSIDSFLTGRAAILGTMNAAGFMFSSMHFFFAVGFGYFLWKRFSKANASI